VDLLKCPENWTNDNVHAVRDMLTRVKNRIGQR